MPCVEDHCLLGKQNARGGVGVAPDAAAEMLGNRGKGKNDGKNDGSKKKSSKIKQSENIRFLKWNRQLKIKDSGPGNPLESEISTRASQWRENY